METKKRKSKGLGLITAMVLTFVITAFSMAPMSALAATDEELWVNGINILLDADNTVTCGEGTAVYSTDTKTLTLNNTTITTGKNGIGINKIGDNNAANILTIELIGKNAITTSETDKIHKGIFSFGIVDIKGEGELSITTSTSSSSYLPRGIEAWGDFSVVNATITIKEASADSYNSTGIGTPSGKFFAKNATITVDGYGMGANVPSGDVTVDGSKFTVRNANRGISGGGAVDNFKIINSTVDCTTTGENALGLTTLQGITIDNSNVTLSSDSSNAIYTNGAITIKNKSDVNLTGYYPALFSVLDTTIADSKVKAISTNDNGIYSKANIIINGTSDVTAKGYYAGLYANGNITVNDGKVNATSTSDIGVYSSGVLTINGGEIYAKGARGFAAIAARSDKQANDQAPVAKIILDNKYSDINGGKISVSNWYDGGSDEAKWTRSWTSFIAKDDTNKLATDRSNAVNEITIKIKSADYAKVDEAIAKIPTDMSMYTAETVKAVTDAKAAVVREKNITEQEIVDGYATAIDNAVKALVKKAIKFSDVSEDDWFAPYITELADKGILNGYGDGTYQPAGNITRGEFCKIMAAAANSGVPSVQSAVAFVDTENHWANEYILWAKENNIVKGNGYDQFLPDDGITREEVAAILSRYAKNISKKEIPAKVAAKLFIDNAKISDWAADAVSALQKAEVVIGYEDNSYRPQNNATRAEAAKMVSTFFAVMK